MKKLTLSLVLLLVMAYSTYAGCCLVKDVTDDKGVIQNLTFKLNDQYTQQKELCSRVGRFISSADGIWYGTECSASPIPSGSVDITYMVEEIIQQVTSGGSNSNMDGVGSSSAQCTQLSYTCGRWSTCEDEEQTRTCKRDTRCGYVTRSQNVTETRDCEVQEGSDEEDEEDSSSSSDTTTRSASSRSSPTESGTEGLADITGRAVADTRSNTNIWIASGVVGLVALLGVGSYFMFFRGKK